MCRGGGKSTSDTFCDIFGPLWTFKKHERVPTHPQKNYGAS